jgi:hypothetical protein
MGRWRREHPFLCDAPGRVGPGSWLDSDSAVRNRAHSRVGFRAAYCPLKSPLLQAVRRWKGTRAGYGWFGGLPRAGKSRSSARKSGGVPLTARCAVSGQPVRRAWGIRSVTRPAVTWDVIEIQPAHQNQGGHPELPKSVERGRVRFILRDVVPTPLTLGETSMATLAGVRRLTSGAYPALSNGLGPGSGHRRWRRFAARTDSVPSARERRGRTGRSCRSHYIAKRGDLPTSEVHQNAKKEPQLHRSPLRDVIPRSNPRVEILGPFYPRLWKPVNDERRHRRSSSQRAPALARLIPRLAATV